MVKISVPTLTVFRGVNAFAHQGAASGSWEDIVAGLSTFAEAPDKATRNRETDYFSPVRLFPGCAHRSDREVEALTIACFDFDKCLPEDVDHSRALIEAAGYAQHWYSSYSHTPARPAYRVLIPITHELSSAAWKVVRAEMVARFHLKVEKGKCESISHGYFVPVVPPGGSGTLYTRPGNAYPTEAVAARFPPGSEPPVEVKVELPPEPDEPIDLAPIHTRLLSAAAKHRTAGDEVKAVLLERVVEGEDLRGGVVQSESGDPVLTQAVALVARAAPGLSMGTYLRVVDSTWREMVEAGSNIPLERVESKFDGILKKIAIEDAARKLEEEKASTIHDIIGPGLAVEAAALGASDDIEAEVRAKVDMLAGGSGSKRTPLPAPERFSTTNDEPDEEERWLVKNLIDDKAFTEVLGQAKAAKTWALIHIAVSIASGRPVFNDDRFTVEKRGPVVLLLREDVKVKAKRRIRAELNSLGLTGEDLKQTMDNLIVWYAAPETALKVTDDESFKQFLVQCKRLGPVAVILDPLRQVHSEDENSNTDMAPVMHRFLWAREILGCTVMLSHHMGKPNEGTNKTRTVQLGRGASVIGDSWEGLIAFSDTDDSDAPHSWTNKVTVMAKNGGTVPPFGLRLEITDNTEGRAVSTAWTVSQDLGPKAEADAQKLAKLVLDVMQGDTAKALALGGQPPVFGVEDLRKRVNRRATLVRDALLMRLAASGHVREVNKRGGSGWVLVDQPARAAGPHPGAAFIDDGGSSRG